MTQREAKEWVARHAHLSASARLVGRIRRDCTGSSPVIVKPPRFLASGQWPPSAMSKGASHAQVNPWDLL